MPKPDGYAQQLINLVADGIELRVKAAEQYLGDIGEYQSPEKQMDAWKALKDNPQLWLMKEQEVGPEEMEKMRREMERREKLSDANR